MLLKIYGIAQNVEGIKKFLNKIYVASIDFFLKKSLLVLLVLLHRTEDI